MRAYKRAHRVTFFVVLIWLEWTSSTIMGVISWLFLKGMIQPSLEYFLSIVILWCFQIHTLMQIIINRVGILSIDRKITRRLKWGVFGTLIVINIAVACIWVPTQLQLSQTCKSINAVSDRVQKSLLCIMDAGLNYYFIHLVRSRLIANGLTKYKRLFHYNLVMAIISISLDILIVTMMSLPNALIYVQVHPVAYLLKLQIEMGMADLIIKIVRASNPSARSSKRYKRATWPVPGDSAVNASLESPLPCQPCREESTNPRSVGLHQREGLFTRSSLITTVNERHSDQSRGKTVEELRVT